MALFIGIALLFLLSPFLSSPLVIYGLFRGGNYRKFYGILFSILIGILVYHIVPTEEMDLSRYYSYMGELQHYGFWGGLSEIWSKSDPLSYSFMYIVSSLWNNNAITLLSSVVGYSTLFYIIFDYARIKNLSQGRIALVLVFFLGSYNIINSFTGIRFALGTSIFLLALYLDLIKKRRGWSLFLYVLSPLFHTSMITLLMIRLAAFLFRKSANLLQYVIIFVVGLSTAFLQQISQFLSGVPFLSILSERADFYLLPHFPPGFWYPFNIAVTLLLIFVLLRLRKKEMINKTIVKINLFVLIVALANIMNYYIASRYIIVGTLLFIISMMDVMAYTQKTHFFKLRRLTFYGSSVLGLIVLGGFYSYQIGFMFEMQYRNLAPYSLMDNVIILLQLSEEI